MDYVWFLFSFKGRINRAKYWLADLIILCSMIFALLSLTAIGALFGIPTGAPFGSTSSAYSALIDPAWPHRPCVLRRVSVFPVSHYSADLRFRVGLRGSFDQAVARPQQERLVDRAFHRCQRPLRPIRRLAGQFLGGGVRLGLPSSLPFMWGLVEMYFLKGTRGPNRFGARPAGPSRHAGRAGTSRAKSK